MKIIKKYNQHRCDLECENCGHKEFFVDTLGIEHCSKCFTPTMYMTEATGKLSYKQIKLEEKLKRSRKKNQTNQSNQAERIR